MKKNFSLLILLQFSFLFSQEKYIQTTAKLDKVSVNFSGAFIKQSFSAEIPEGKSLIFISNFSRNVDVNNMEISNDKNVKIIYSNYFNQDSSNYAKIIGNKDISKISDSIKSYEEQIDKLKNDILINNNSIAIIQKNQEIEKFDKNEVLKIIDFNKEQLKKLYTEKESLNEKIDLFEDKIELLKNRKDKIYRDEKKENILVLSVVSKSAQKVSFNLNYFTNYARWYPYYQIKSGNTDQALKINYKAKIYQNTGIDWQTTKIFLISGDSETTSRPYELDRWFLQTQSETYTSNQAFQSHYKSSSKNTYAVAEVSSNIEQKTLITQIELPQNTVIQSSEKETITDLQEYNIATEYKHYSAPKLDSRVFLLAYIEDYSKYNFLPGIADIYMEEVKVGQINIEPSQISEKMLISLGEDKNVLIKRNLLSKNTEFLKENKSKKENYKYEILIKNNKNKKINLEIRDQIPLSTNELIKIEVYNPQNAEYQKENGFLIWNLNINPNETRKINFGFNITLPEELTITNAN